MLVFQYGSNTSAERLNSPERLAGAAVAVGLAQTVLKYRIAFTYRSKANDCGVADLIPDDVTGRHVLGVAYFIPEERIFRGHGVHSKTLDQIEGEGTAYRRIEIEVLLPDGARTRALTYVVLTPEINHPTSVQYVEYIITGLRRHDAPREYLEYIVACASESCPELTQSFRALTADAAAV